MTTIYDIQNSSSASSQAMPKVLFVGAGPGAADMITVRGMHLLQNADVVVYAGSLVNPALLDHCPAHCQCHDSAGMDLVEQVCVMSKAALAGLNVVRLHTGDPAMYGAINEQIRLLSENNVAVEIVAGVSSVFAAAAALGCELTSPEISQSVVLTRTAGRTPMPSGEDAAAFARTGATLVFFLSTGKIDSLMNRLASSTDTNGGGLHPDTPAAVVYRASWPQERILRGTISTIAKQVEEAGFGRQALIFVGQALAQRPTLSKLYDGAFSHGYRNALPRESFVGRCALYAFTQKGTDKAVEIATALQLPCVVYSQHHHEAPQSLAIQAQTSLDANNAALQIISLENLERGTLSETVAQAWNQFDGHIFVGAAGIAVRAIAPLLESKAVDPAVLTCAESGAHIVSLTAGHLGGANRLARRVARTTGGQAVISTATDGRNLPAFDEVAAALKTRIVNPHALRSCNAALLDEKIIHFYGPRSVYDAYFALPTIIYINAQWSADDFTRVVAADEAQATPTILWDAPATSPWLALADNADKLAVLLASQNILVTEAKSFVLGIGCRRGMDSDKMRATVADFLANHGLTLDNVARLATCDVKADEAAILDLSQTGNIPVDFYASEQLAAVPVPTPSQRVAAKIGTPSVCEAAALLSASYPKAQRLFATKHKFEDMTLALARIPHGLMQLYKYAQQNQADSVQKNIATNAFADMADGGVVVVGLGSGAPAHLTPEVAEALRHCDTVAGYTPYVDFIRHLITDKNIIQNGMMGEMARCRATLEAAASGQKVCMVCSGDAGILAMAGLLFELRHNARTAKTDDSENNKLFADVNIKVLAGITAANIAAASLGAPLQNGFSLVSLSDLLVPTDEVRANLKAVAQSALPVTLYNPAGKKRRELLSEAVDIFRQARGSDVLCATVRHAGREQESKWIGRLADLPVDSVDMSTLVLIGGPRTMQDGDVLFEARGYADKYTLDVETSRKQLSAPLHACCIAAPRSGEGKTMVSMAIMRLLILRGMTVQGFKCGPDYIDPTFHSQATGRAACNLDTWMMGADGVRALWSHRVLDDAKNPVDAAICEGVMGLLDGKALNTKVTANKAVSIQNCKPFPIAGSTLDTARVLNLPIILVVNARGMATSIAALVHGFVNMAQRYDTQIVGIIANNAGSSRHVDMLRTALKLAKLPPLVGAIPRSADWSLPERQLGLVPQNELGEQSNLAWLDAMVTAMEPHLEVDALLNAIRIPRPSKTSQQSIITHEKQSSAKPKIMAIARDKAFCFYYDANLAALRQRGWELVEFSPLHDAALPHPCDALYLGGGYPEEFAADIAANAAMRQSIQNFAARGGLVYAECGGYMALAKSLVDAHGVEHEMYGLINATARMGSRLKSLGYREFILQAKTPFADVKTTIRGHEFHWSDMEHHENYAPLYTYNGQGVGVSHGNILAGYGHLYWAHLPKDEQIQNDSSQQKNGKVIIFNGPSSAGKSTLVALVQKKLHMLGFPTLSLSMDHFLQATSCGHKKAIEAMAHDDAVVQSLHGAVSAAAHAGTSVLVDHVLGEDEAWYNDIIQRLDFTPYLIQVHCHLPELERRECLRNDRNPDLEHVRRQHANIHKSLAYDFSVDTSDASPDDCADVVVNKISSYFSI